MIDKFSTQFLRIFSTPSPLPAVVGLDGEESDVFQAISERELDRRIRYYEEHHRRVAAVEEARVRWQTLVDEAHRARLEYISALGWIDPQFVLEHERDNTEGGNR